MKDLKMGRVAGVIQVGPLIIILSVFIRGRRTYDTLQKQEAGETRGGAVNRGVYGAPGAPGRNWS